MKRWRERGRAGREPFATFEGNLEQAEIDCEAFHVLNGRSHAPEDWRASKEFLAKRFPERWSDHAGRLAVLGPEVFGGQLTSTFHIEINLGPDLTPEVYEAWGKAGRPKAIEVKAQPIPIEDATEPPPDGEARN